MSTQVEFLNKNWYRKYPLRASSKYQATNGVQLPQTLFSGASLSTISRKKDLCISKIVVKKPYVNITVSTSTEDIGTFSGVITKDNTELKLVAFNNFASGFIVLGKSEDWSALYDGTYFLDQTNGQFEGSVVHCFNPPTVTAITSKGKIANGAVKLAFDNITEVVTENIQLAVTNLDLISLNGIQSSLAASCPTNVLTGINTVEPWPETSGGHTKGNIDIYGIEPVVVTVDSTVGIKIQTPTLAFLDGSGVTGICQNINKNIPPLINSDLFLAIDDCGHAGVTWTPDNITHAAMPEWQHYWPQYAGQYDLPVCHTTTTTTSTTPTTTTTTTTSSTTTRGRVIEDVTTTSTTTTTRRPDAVLMIKLQWGWPPSNLDAHMQTPQVPNSSGNVWHIRNTGSGYYATRPFSKLLADTLAGSSLPVEKLVVINPMDQSGVWHYYVHNSTPGVTDILGAAAFVRLYKGTNSSAPFTVSSIVYLPTGPGVTTGSTAISCTAHGNYWHVFDLDPAEVTVGNPYGIKIINTVSNTPPTYTTSGLGVSDPGPTV